MENGYYLEGTGTAWSLMTEGGTAFGVKGEEIPLDEARINQALSQGHPVVLSLRPGDFTTEGHFIVLVEKQDGTLWMLLRLKTGIGEAFSPDGGKTWREVRKSGIWGPNARFFIRRLRSGRLLLVNHAQEEGGGASSGRRNRLAAFLSEDDGKTWSKPLILDCREDVSYPDGVEREDGLIYIIYDRSRFEQKEILMAKFREKDVLAQQMVSVDGELQILVDKAGE